MDHARPIQALFPGARGAVLDVLTRVQRGMTIRQLADRAGVSHPQVSRHVSDLEALGIVRREHVGRSHVITLSGTMAADLIRRIATLRQDAIGTMQRAALAIEPRPLALILFGSFARGDDDARSDIDVLVVIDDAMREGEIDASLSEWCLQVTALTGNPVAEILIRRGDIDGLDADLRSSIEKDGVAILGDLLPEGPRLRIVAEARGPYGA